MRVAVVGGGVAGMSTALQLAPLVKAGLLASPIDIYDAACPGKPWKKTGREIGVGIWSTALDPFRCSDQASHQMVYREMTKQGTWVENFGYRTTNGDWLMRTTLPTPTIISTNSAEEMTMARNDNNMPALLFLREKDVLGSLQKAVRYEEIQETIAFHRHDRTKSRVAGIHEASTLPWSAQLQLEGEGDRRTERDYHLIVGANGMHSILRRTYGGHQTFDRTLMGTKALMKGDFSYDSWDASQQEIAVRLQDRKYTVFRGNSPLTSAEIGECGTSFQTWGEGHRKRFAMVPMRYPSGANGEMEERQVWFITIDDDRIAAEEDPVQRRAMLLDAFGDWHDPIRQTVLATPPEEILMERAIAHKHSVGPVLDVNHIIHKMRGKRPSSSGMGPCLVFLGDAYMTIDPILAQGYTVAMEATPSLRESVEQSCQQCQEDPSLAFDPYMLRTELRVRNDKRFGRIINLLRATQLVQTLGQPAGSTLSGFLNTKLLRPLAKLTPSFIKKPIFEFVLRYSLGLTHSRKPEGVSVPPSSQPSGQAS